MIHNLLDEVERAAAEEGLEFTGIKRGDRLRERAREAGQIVDDVLDPEVDARRRHRLAVRARGARRRARHARRRRGRPVQPRRHARLRDVGAPARPARRPAPARPGDAGRPPRRLGRQRARARARRARDDPGGAGRLPRGDAADAPGRSAASSRRRSTRGGSTRSPSARERTTSDGVGVRWLAVEHEGNRVDSEEEADAIAAEIERLLGHTFRDGDGERPLRTRRRDGRRALQRPGAAAARAASRLRSRSARSTSSRAARRPVVFYSMASSSGEDVPRGLDFLMSRNRLNVAVSRAQCLAYVACSPRLLEVDCRTVEHLKLANALCRFVEHARLARRAKTLLHRRTISLHARPFREARRPTRQTCSSHGSHGQGTSRRPRARGPAGHRAPAGGGAGAGRLRRVRLRDDGDDARAGRDCLVRRRAARRGRRRDRQVARLVRPSRPIPAEATAVHGISDEELCPRRPSTRSHASCASCSTAPCSSRTTPFDLAMLEHAFALTGIDYCPVGVACTLDAFRLLEPLAGDHRLQSICDRRGIAFEDAHEP